MNENNPPINSGTKNSEKPAATNPNVGSGYFARIIADATRGLKIGQDIDSNQSLIDSLEQDDQLITQKTSNELPPQKAPLVSESNSEDANSIKSLKAAQTSLKLERKSSPLQVREKFNSDLSSATPKHVSENQIFSKNEKVSELQPKYLYNQVQNDTATASASKNKDVSDKISTPIPTTPEKRINKNNNSAENILRENTEPLKNNVEKATKSIQTESSMQVKKDTFDYLPNNKPQRESQVIQKMPVHEQIKNSRMNAATSLTNKSIAPEPKLHIGEVNIKVVDSAQNLHSGNTNSRAVQKTATTAATSTSAESRTFLRTL